MLNCDKIYQIFFLYWELSIIRKFRLLLYVQVVYIFSNYSYFKVSLISRYRRATSLLLLKLIKFRYFSRQLLDFFAILLSRILSILLRDYAFYLLISIFLKMRRHYSNYQFAIFYVFLRSRKFLEFLDLSYLRKLRNAILHIVSLLKKL